MQTGLHGITGPIGVGNLRYRPKVPGARSSPANQRLTDGLYLKVEDFGAKGDGRTDESAAIQRAITYLENNRGGFLQFGPKDYVVKSNPGIRVKKSGVQLIGTPGGYTFGTASGVGTRIIYAGATNGTVMQFEPDSTLSPYIMSSVSARGFILDANGLADYCLKVGTVYDYVMEDLDAQNPLFIAFYTGTTWSTGGFLNYRGTFSKCVANVSGSANGFFLDGHQGVSGGYNTSFCSFYDCHSTIENGAAFFLRKCDDCCFFNIGVSKIPGGTGQSVRFFGSNTTDFYAATGNTFFGLNSGADILVDAGTNFQARGNKVYLNSVDHQIVVTDSAGLLFIEDQGSYDSSIIPYYRTPIINSTGAKRTTSDFSKTSDTTFANVPGLSVNLAAGKTYKFRAVLHCGVGTTGGSKVTMSGTATATAVRFSSSGINLTGGPPAFVLATTSNALGGAGAGGAGGTFHKVEVDGVITVNAAGTLTAQYAQVTSNGTPSTVLTGSTLEVWQLD